MERRRDIKKVSSSPVFDALSIGGLKILHLTTFWKFVNFGLNDKGGLLYSQFFKVEKWRNKIYFLVLFWMLYRLPVSEFLFKDV